jgi:hypothetical protein
VLAARPARDLADRQAHPRRALELCASFVDQVVADVRGALVVAIPAGFGGAFMRELDRLSRNLALRQRAAFRDFLDRVPVAIARREIHSP